MERSRIAEAMEEVTARRGGGENIAPVLPDIAEAYHINPEHLKSRAEVLWGAPIETDTVRYAAYFEKVMLRKWAEAEKAEFRCRVLTAAKKNAANTWYNCSPDGSPDWQYYCNLVLKAEGVVDSGLREEVSRFFRNVDRDFGASRSAYRKLVS